MIILGQEDMSCVFINISWRLLGEIGWWTCVKAKTNHQHFGKQDTKDAFVAERFQQ